MSKSSYKIEKNAAILIITQALTKVFGIAVTIAVARMLGVKDFGLLNFAGALAGLALVIPNFGFDQLAVRELARCPSRASQFLVNISAIKGILYIPAAGVCTFVVLLGPQPGDRLFVVLIVFLFLATQEHLGFICSFFRAIQKMEREALVKLIFSALLFVTGLAILFVGFGIKTLVVSRLTVSILALGLAILWIKKDFGIILVKVSWRYSKMLISMGLPLATLYILVVVYTSINLVILGLIKGDIAVGYYSASYKIVELFWVIPIGLTGAFFPELSKNWGRFPKVFYKAFQKSMRYLLLLAIPLAVGTFFLGEKGIIMLFGRDYTQSVAVIKVLALCIVPVFLNYILSVTLISMRRDKVAAAGALVGVSAALGSSLLFIFRWGAIGAAASLLVTECAVFLFQGVFLIRECKIFGVLVTSVRAVLATSIMAIGLSWLVRIGMPLPLLVGCSVFVYASALLVFGELKFHEVKRGYEVLKNLVRS